MTTRIIVISAGLRVPSTTRALADAAVRSLSRTITGADVTVVDLREHAHGITDALLTGFVAGAVSEVVEDVYAADALVLVTPTFGGTFSGLLKTFVDILDPDRLAAVPVLLAATGGTERHSLMLEFALRPLAVQVGLRPVPTAIFVATADFGTSGEESWGRRLDRAASELRDALGGVDRDVVRPGDPFAEVTPFADLLHAGGTR